MKALKGTRTHDNLKAAFAGESQANRRYLYFANKADVEGQNDIAARVPLDRRRRDRPRARASRLPGRRWAIRPPTCRSAAAARTSRPPSPARRTSTPTCIPGMAKAARDEGFDEIADWFETLAKAERSHANRFQKALEL